MNYPIISTRTSALFPRSYDGSRARFRNNLDTIRQRWPRAQLHSYRLSGDEELTIDWIATPGLVRNDKLLVITTGEHGIEAYVGSAIQQLMIDEYLSQLDPARTGLLLVHAINPWGMKYWRRVNRNNVDLNRNFIWEKLSETEGRRRYDPNINLDYERLQKFLNPQRAFSGRWLGMIRFLFGLTRALSRVGVDRLSAASTLGQYHTPKGIYFGGEQRQEETEVIIKLLREHFRAFRQILHIDLHTGYGPRYRMSLVNSPLESRKSSYFVEQFGYPSVVKATSEDFFGIQGDMIDYVYRLVFDEFPDKGLYATAFEFGTLGESTLARLRSLWTIILENQVHNYGAKTQTGRDFVVREFRELFYPSDPYWRQQAVLDARQALTGILEGEGFRVG
jgi:hypothetical protein